MMGRLTLLSTGSDPCHLLAATCALSPQSLRPGLADLAISRLCQMKGYLCQQKHCWVDDKGNWTVDPWVSKSDCSFGPKEGTRR